MITAAAYKFAVAAMLPPVAYLTLIDKYVFSLSGLLLLCCLRDGILGLLRDDGALRFSSQADHGTTLGLFVVYVLYHAYFGVTLRAALKLRRETVGEEVANQAHIVVSGTGKKQPEQQVHV